MYIMPLYTCRAAIKPQQWCAAFSEYTIWMPGALCGEHGCLHRVVGVACCDMHVPSHLQMHTPGPCYQVRSLLPVGLLVALQVCFLVTPYSCGMLLVILVTATFDRLLYCLILVWMHVLLVTILPVLLVRTQLVTSILLAALLFTKFHSSCFNPSDVTVISHLNPCDKALCQRGAVPCVRFCLCLVLCVCVLGTWCVGCSFGTLGVFAGGPHAGRQKAISFRDWTRHHHMKGLTAFICMLTCLFAVLGIV